MQITDAQRTTLKTYIANDATLAAFAAQSAWQPIADALNAASTAIVWRTSVPVDEITNQINWAALTPADAPDGTQTWANRSLTCQGKQFNLQLIIAGRGEIPGSLSNVRLGLQDALTGIPSGVGGATQAANWTGVRDAMKRVATVGENVFATGTKTQATPGLLVVEGQFDRDIVENTWVRG